MNKSELVDAIATDEEAKDGVLEIVRLAKSQISGCASKEDRF